MSEFKPLSADYCDICGELIKGGDSALILLEITFVNDEPSLYQYSNTIFVGHKDCWYDPEFAKQSIGITIL